MDVLKDSHLTDRNYQQYLSHYMDFLISENLEPDEVYARVAAVRAGKKPGPLPVKKQEADPDGLGLPRLPELPQ
jgi:hypothetical protein